MQKKVQEYYQKRKDEIVEIMDPDKSYKYKFDRDANQNPVVDLLDTTGKSVLKAKYNVIGIYNVISSIWFWSWNVDFIDKKLVKVDGLVKDFSKKLKTDFDKFDPKYAESMYFYMSNGNFYMTSENVPKLVKTVLKLSNGKWFLIVKHFNDTIQDDQGNSPLMYMEYVILDEFVKFQ